MSATSSSPGAAPPDARAAAARDWALAQLGLGAATFAPASADASFRRYFRLSAAGQSWIVMDAPPEREDCRPFLQIAGLLATAGLRVPRCLAQDLARGYLLLSDLGRHTYLQVLTEDNADALFEPAIEALIQLQLASRPGVLPPYDEALLRRELALFPDWYLARERGLTLSGTELAAWRALEDRLVASALAQPRVWVHRDFMPRNLMGEAPAPGQPVPPPGVLDFQDAVEGPISYDPICLFKDAFRSWPEPRVEGWLRRYWQQGRAAGLPLPPEFETFQRQADWMGVQRHLKVIGIFARIAHRDGKPAYLADVARFFSYLRTVSDRYPELAALQQRLEAWQGP
ncbi:MAG TPA: phosphotransferase [Nevskiaceae bacterium]|nr:phosphotransferase [Nevskiaceae bacterium]